MSTTRITVNLSSAAVVALDDVSARLDDTKTHVVCRALVLLQLLMNVADQGGVVRVQRPGDDRVRELWIV